MISARAFVWAAWGSAFAGITLATTIAKADDSFDAPIAGITLSEGPRWGWGAPSAATMGSAGAFAGLRSTEWRFGALGRVGWWEGSHGPVVDGGLFGSRDVASLFLDPQISAAWFVRIEAAFRWESDASVWALAPSAITGVRVLGFEIGVAGTYERWLSSLPGDAGKNGVGAEVRLGLDLVEFSQFFIQKAQGSTPQTP